MKKTIWFLILLVIAISVVFGITMMFSGKTALAATPGEALYESHCKACHIGGGNAINPALPVKGSTKMKNLAVFIAFNRNPVKADGTPGAMPAFPKDKLSDADLKLIYEYSLKLTGPSK